MKIQSASTLESRNILLLIWIFYGSFLGISKSCKDFSRKSKTIFENKCKHMKEKKNNTQDNS